MRLVGQVKPAPFFLGARQRLSLTKAILGCGVDSQPMICPACEAGPKGIDGHPEISLVHEADRKHHALFVCRKCGQKYTRTYEGGGMFIWLRVADAPA